MKNEHLISTARDRASLLNPFGKAATDKIIKEKFGLDPGVKNSTVSINDQIFNLMNKASDLSSTFIKNAINATDPVNVMARSYQTNYGYMEDIHPLDEAFIILQSAAKMDADEKNQKDNLRKSGKMDPADEFEDRNFGSLNHKFFEKRSSNDLYSLASEIFARCPNGKTVFQGDPINEDIKNAYGQGLFFEQPVHTLAEWNKEIEKATGDTLSNAQTKNETTVLNTDIEVPAQISKSVNPSNANINNPKANVSASTVKKDNELSSDLAGELIDEIVTKITVEKFSNKEVMEAIRKTVRRPK